MRRLTLAVVALMAVGSLRAADPPREVIEARRAGLNLALTIVEKLDGGEPKRYPGIAAWLEDFRKATKDFDPKGDAAKWPAFNVDAVVSRNPNFWRAL